MGGPRKPRCAKNDHNWKPMKRGGAHEQCTKCGDVFPCRSACEHLDCIVATGRPIPDYYADPEKAREGMLAELAIIAPTVYAAIGKPKRKRTKRALPEAITMADVSPDFFTGKHWEILTPTCEVMGCTGDRNDVRREEPEATFREVKITDCSSCRGGTDD